MMVVQQVPECWLIICRSYDSVAPEYPEYRITSRKNRSIYRIDEAGSDRNDDKENITLSEFIGKYLPSHARKKRLSSNTYDNLVTTFKLHIVPYFGKTFINDISNEDIDNFIDYLFQKKCAGFYKQDPNTTPTLSSSTVRKTISALYTALSVAKEWGYIESVPTVKTPDVK